MLVTIWTKYCLYFGHLGLKKEMDKEDKGTTYISVFLLFCWKCLILHIRLYLGMVRLVTRRSIFL